eukprot:35551_1
MSQFQTYLQKIDKRNAINMPYFPMNANTSRQFQTNPFYQKMLNQLGDSQMSQYLDWQLTPLQKQMKYRKEKGIAFLTEEELKTFHCPDISICDNTHKRSRIDRELTMFKTNEFSVNMKWCYNCFKSNEICTLLNCTKCKLAKYCSIKCQRENWIFHKRVCSSETINFIKNEKQNTSANVIDGDVLYNTIQEFKTQFQSGWCDHRTLIRLKLIHAGYQLRWRRQLNISEQCVNKLPCIEYLDAIGQLIHQFVRYFSLDKLHYINFYRTFLSVPGMVEYILHETFVNKHLLQLRKNGFGYWKDLPNKKQFDQWSSKTAFGNDDCINEWSWWIINIYSRLVTHDACIPQNRMPSNAVDEGKTQFMDEYIMPIAPIIKRKIVKLFLNIDVLESCDEGVMAISINIMTTYLKTNNAEIKHELIKNGLLRSIIFVSNRSSNTVGTVNLLKQINPINDIQYITSKYDRIVLFINIFKHFQSVQQQLYPTGFLDQIKSKIKLKQ